MALTHRARRAWSIAILLIGLPIYIVAAVSVLTLFDRPPIWVELVVYVALGIVWALPFRFVFLGSARDDSDEGGGR